MLDSIQTITLLGLPGFGKAKVNSIMKEATFQPSNLAELLELIIELNGKVPRLKIPNNAQLEKSYDIAKRTIEQSEKLGIKILTPLNSSFPLRLKHIPDPPAILYVKGNVECLNSELSVAVIGTREPSAYGEKCGQLFARKFTEKGLVIVSGLAKGIDTAGHQGCLSAKGQTIAVLAQGLDTGIYPSENRPLADKIIDEGGCLVSEYTLGVRGRPNFFVERDRLQAGLSSGVTVIETDIKGGTMHTAGYCLEQKKPLGCLNHPEKFLKNNDKARGNQKLINEGKAMSLFSPEETDSYISKMEKLSDFKKRLEKLAIQSKPKKSEQKNKQDNKGEEDSFEQMKFF